MIHTIYISITTWGTSDFSSAIDRATVARSKSEEKLDVPQVVIEITLTVNHSHSEKVLHLLGASPLVGAWRFGAGWGRSVLTQNYYYNLQQPRV